MRGQIIVINILCRIILSNQLTVMSPSSIYNFYQRACVAAESREHTWTKPYMSCCIKSQIRGSFYPFSPFSNISKVKASLPVSIDWFDQHDNTLELKLKTLKKYKSKMNREVCLFDKFSYCKNGVKCLRIHLKEVCWNRECDYRKCNQTHTGKMPISAFFEHWENLPYNSQLLHNLANLDNMDVQICLFICLIWLIMLKRTQLTSIQSIYHSC